jgi:succinyl-diaminopimelate desuccinylase
MTIDAVELARKLVAFPSTNPPGEEKACADFVAQLLAEQGFAVERYEFAPGRPSLVAKTGGTSGLKPLCFTGHLDVVPVGNSPWRHPPFAAVVEDGKLHGRGSADMKSGVAAFITAACALRARGATFRRGLTFVITAGEETGCEGAFDLARRGVLGDAQLLIVAEPTSNRPIAAHKGSFRVAVTARGRSAHSSMPQEGDNAIVKAMGWIAALQAHRFDESHPLLGTPTAAVTTFTGGQAINVIPDSARFTADFRTLPGQDHAALLAELRGMFGPEAEIEVLTDFPGYATSPDEPAVQPLLDLLEKRLGARPMPSGAPYFTDASALVPGFGGAPTIVIGPGQADQCHKTDEHCALSDIHDAVALYRDLIERLCVTS